MYRKVKLLASVGPTPFKKQIIHDDGKNNLMLKTCPKTLKESNGHNESEIQKNYEKEDEIIDNKSKTEAKKGMYLKLFPKRLHEIFCTFQGYAHKGFF